MHTINKVLQEGSADTLLLERGTAEEQRADFIARVFGWTKVGWVFAQSSGQRDYILSVDEICQMAAVQNEMGQEAVSGVVSMSPDGDVHFEAFQVRLFEQGCFICTARPGARQKAFTLLVLTPQPPI